MSEKLIRWFIRRFCVPYFDLGDYMERWWVVKPRSWLPFAIRIHHIRRSDIGPELHCHPWWYVTLLLRGSYKEMYEKHPGYIVYHVKKSGSLSFHSANFKHRLFVDESEGSDGVWSFFIHGKKSKEWGFYDIRTNEFIHWQDYDKMEQRIGSMS